jgi:hypothetical protein
MPARILPISREGNWICADTFLSFDKRAVETMAALGEPVCQFA